MGCGASKAAVANDPLLLGAQGADLKSGSKGPSSNVFGLLSLTRGLTADGVITVVRLSYIVQFDVDDCISFCIPLSDATCRYSILLDYSMFKVSPLLCE
jgi:hypothetical protein